MKTKKEKKRLFFISFIIIILIVFLGVSTYKDFVTIVNNKRETKKLNTQYEKLLDEKKSLTSEVTKMNDPEYLARYAKEKFLYSKDDEVFVWVNNYFFIISSIIPYSFASFEDI
jgi:cell division protein DivIC